LQTDHLNVLTMMGRALRASDDTLEWA